MAVAQYRMICLALTVIPYLMFNAIKTHKSQFDVNVTNGVLPVWWMEVYTLFVLTNQNHCYMPKLNDTEIQVPLFVLVFFFFFFYICTN